MWSTVWPESQLTERMTNWLHLHLLYVPFSSSLPLSFDLKGNKIKKKYDWANCCPGKSFYCDKTLIVPYLILFLNSVIFIENMLHVGAAAATTTATKKILLLHMWKIKGRERLLIDSTDSSHLLAPDLTTEWQERILLRLYDCMTFIGRNVQ